MAEDTSPPDQRTLVLHLKSARFLAGVESGRWTVLNEAFPHVYVRVVGRDFETDHTHACDFHLLCDGYPDTVPFVERWDFASNRRPPPPGAGDPAFVDALKDWSPGGIYRAWQRHASMHNDWAHKRPDEAWHRNREISFVMEQLYALVSQQTAWLAARLAA